MKKWGTQERQLFLCFPEKSDSFGPFQSQICKTKQKPLAYFITRRILQRELGTDLVEQLWLVSMTKSLFFSSPKENLGKNEIYIHIYMRTFVKNRGTNQKDVRILFIIKKTKIILWWRNYFGHDVCERTVYRK